MSALSLLARQLKPIRLSFVILKLIFARGRLLNFIVFGVIRNMSIRYHDSLKIIADDRMIDIYGLFCLPE